MNPPRRETCELGTVKPIDYANLPLQPGSKIGLKLDLNHNRRNGLLLCYVDQKLIAQITDLPMDVCVAKIGRPNGGFINNYSFSRVSARLDFGDKK